MRIRKNRPNATIARIILAEIVLAIEKLHELNIVHHDLGADNILIGNAGHLVLADFGISKQFEKGYDKGDWIFVYILSRKLFTEATEDEHEQSLIKFLETMTDDQLPGN